MKILSSHQIRQADQHTIKNEPIKSIDLMERASQAFVTKFLGLLPEKQPVFVFCGTGNNGGDGLAIARMLRTRDWSVSLYIVGSHVNGSADFKINLNKITAFEEIKSNGDFPDIPSGSIIIDGLFGSGLSRPIDGLYRDLILFLNDQNSQRIAIDIASGLYADQPLPKEAIAFKADYTVSFQVPKLTFFLPESEKYVGTWRAVDIGLNAKFIDDQRSDYHLIEKSEISGLLPQRSTFIHKNKVGRLMIIAGSKGKMGAAVLCTKAAFRSGAGLVNVQTPACGIEILQISIPEAMVSASVEEDFVTEMLPSDDVIAIGPGLGTHSETAKAFEKLLRKTDKPLVIDADGINILAENKNLIALLPKGSILTPHPGEFRRLLGGWDNDFEKLAKLKNFCKTHKLNFVLKGAYSAICDSSGMVYFNPTGNPGLATAGSGDVLTGMIGAFLAQGLSPIDALKLGVYLHGAAGDEAVRIMETPWIQASDIVDFIPNAVGFLMN